MNKTRINESNQEKYLQLGKIFKMIGMDTIKPIPVFNKSTAF